MFQLIFHCLYKFVMCVISGTLGLGGVAYLCSCITDNYNPVTVQWQWLLGRFYMLNRILEDYPTEFIVHPQKDLPSKHDSAPRNYTKVMTVLKFTTPTLDHSHGKCARRVFYLVALMQTHNREVFNEIGDLLNDLNTNIQVGMKRRLLRVAEEFHLSEKVLRVVEKEEEEDLWMPLFTTPTLSATSTPRCNSPVSVLNVAGGAQGTHITVTVSNFANFPLQAPNPPKRLRYHKSQVTHSTQTDQESLSGVVMLTRLERAMVVRACYTIGLLVIL